MITPVLDLMINAPSMNLQAVLQNDLIVLRPLIISHFDALYEVAKDPLIWQQHPSSDRYQKDIFTEFFNQSIESKGAYVIIDKVSGQVIGSTRFNTIVDVDDAIEIGWSFLSRDKWGGQYNFAMKKLLIDYAFDYVDHIIFYVDKTNVRSQKAIEKLGGKVVHDQALTHLVRKNDQEWTYRIGKEDWIG